MYMVLLAVVFCENLTQLAVYNPAHSVLHYKTKQEQVDRFNYAAADCSAMIRYSNQESRNAKSLLAKTREMYLLSPCSAKTMFVVELCQEIQVDTIMLANYEMFSSSYKLVKIGFSRSYPTDKWEVYEQQVPLQRNQFLFSVPKRWAKYLKFEFFYPHTNHHYCTLSELRVFGTSMLEEYRKEEKKEQKQTLLLQDKGTLESILNLQSLKLTKFTNSSDKGVYGDFLSRFANIEQNLNALNLHVDVFLILTKNAFYSQQQIHKQRSKQILKRLKSFEDLNRKISNLREKINYLQTHVFVLEIIVFFVMILLFKRKQRKRLKRSSSDPGIYLK